MYQYMTTKSKIVSIDKLVDNNAYDSTIKMKPVYVKDNRYIDSSKKGNNKDPKFKAGYEYQNTKAILLKDILQIRLKKFL